MRGCQSRTKIGGRDQGSVNPLIFNLSDRSQWYESPLLAIRHILQRYCCFRLEADGLVQVEQGGDAIEEPAHAGGGGRIDAFAQHLAEERAFTGAEMQQSEPDHPDQGQLPRIAPRARPGPHGAAL